jgi:hypothetical protein
MIPETAGGKGPNCMLCSRFALKVELRVLGNTTQS